VYCLFFAPARALEQQRRQQRQQTTNNQKRRGINIMAYRLFIGNLPMDIKEKEIDDLFYK
jgi:RNA recognition motif-containing protein